MKIIVAPDKFKESLTTFEAAACISEGIRAAIPGGEILSFPMADGGDGFASVMQYYLHTETIHCKSVDPLGRAVNASWQWQPSGKTAIIELAVCSGLALLEPAVRNPMETSTFGSGVLVRDAIKKGAQKIILGLGGSATNDGGTGLLAALGFTFYNAYNQVLDPRGRTLSQMERIVPPADLPAIKFEIACDVQNILHGPAGAAFIYAPQKGATAADVLLLDEGLKNLARVLLQHTGKKVDEMAGTGAAGGIAAGLMAYFEVSLRKGILMVLEASHIEKAICDADLVITGEGKLDGQSKEGKVVAGVAEIAARHGVPAIAFCGQLDMANHLLQQMGLAAAFSIMNRPMPLQDATTHAGALLQDCVRNVFSFHHAAKEKSTTRQDLIPGI